MQVSRDATAREELALVTFAACCALGGYLLVALSAEFLPERFFLDATVIQLVATNRLVAGGGSYQVTADFYTALGLADAPTLAGLLGYSLAVVCIMLVVIRYRRTSGGRPVVALVGISMLLSAVYLSTYSKEVFSLGVVLLVLVLPERRWAEGALVAAMLVYADGFRSYWFIVTAGYIATSWVLARSPRLPRVRTLAAIAVAGVVAASLAIWFLQGVPANHYRLNAGACSRRPPPACSARSLTCPSRSAGWSTTSCRLGRWLFRSRWRCSVAPTT